MKTMTLGSTCNYPSNRSTRPSFQVVFHKAATSAVYISYILEIIDTIATDLDDLKSLPR